jgi:hypothetical protein
MFVDHVPPFGVLGFHFQGLVDIISATMQHGLVSRLHDRPSDIGVAS